MIDALKLAGRRRTPALLASVAAALVAVVTGATPAHATAYRYWSYWKWSGSTWVYSNIGPSGSLHDGDVIGWRFATQADSRHALAPRTSGSNATLCGGSGGGIGVVIDYGVDRDAPSGESPPRSAPRGFCATKTSDNNGYRATAEHATVRVNNSGLVCGIDGYPKTECGAQVTTTSSPSPHATTPAPAPTHHRSPAPKRAAASSHPSTTSPAARSSAANTATTPTPQPGHNSHPGSPASGLTAPSDTPSPLALVVDPHSPDHSSGGGAPIGLIVGGSAAAVLGGGAVWRFRRQA